MEIGIFIARGRNVSASEGPPGLSQSIYYKRPLYWKCLLAVASYLLSLCWLKLARNTTQGESKLTMQSSKLTANRQAVKPNIHKLTFLLLNYQTKTDTFVYRNAVICKDKISRWNYKESEWNEKFCHALQGRLEYFILWIIEDRRSSNTYHTCLIFCK